MSKRMLDTKVWDDDYVLDLDPTEKLLFMYFLTNSKTNLAGIYEINIKLIAFETGIDKDMILKIIDRFKEDGKLSYNNNYIILVNWTKHQNLRNKNIRLGIARILNDEVSSEVKSYIFSNTTLHKNLIEKITEYNLVNDYE